MSELDKLLARGEQLEQGTATVSLAELMLFRHLARRVVLSEDERDRLLQAIKNGFSSDNSTCVMFTSDVLVHALHGQKLTPDEVKWLFPALVEVPQSAYSFGGTLSRFPRDSQYRMLAAHNGCDMLKAIPQGLGLLAFQDINPDEWIRASAAVYSVTHDRELLLTLMYFLKMNLRDRSSIQDREQHVALEILADLATWDSGDAALKESLLALLMQQLPGSPTRCAVEEQLLKLATLGEDEKMKRPIQGNDDRKKASKKGNVRKGNVEKAAKRSSGTAVDSRTWIKDESIEHLISSACSSAESRLSQEYDASPRSHEERLTGLFLSSLEYELRRISPSIEQWAQATLGQRANFTCGYEDVAARGPEKLWGADIGFYVEANVAGRISFRRAVLAQVKKQLPETSQSWAIEPLQRDVLLNRSPFSIYLLYGGGDTGVTVLPAATVQNIMSGANTQTRIHRDECAGGRPFHDFFVYDLIADWWGDRDGPVFDLRSNALTDFAVRWLFRVTITAGTPEAEA